MKECLKVALVGNPNTGKSTLFNVLTGLNQKVGNFPGITVEKKIGYCKLENNCLMQLTDMPGTYSLYPKSKDEAIVIETLTNKNHPDHPDLVVLVVDATNLKRNLLLFTQVADLKIPVIIALNMIDLARKAGIEINVDKLAKKLGVLVVPISARRNAHIDQLKQAICNAPHEPLQIDTIDIKALAPSLIQAVQEGVALDQPYLALQLIHQHENANLAAPGLSASIEQLKQGFSFNTSQIQAAETLARYSFINDILFDTVKKKEEAHQETLSNRIDKVLTHKFWGIFIFLGVLFIIFQSIFSWAEYPMGMIEECFVWLESQTRAVLPPGMLTDLLASGVLAGLSGVMVFTPQIAFLFAFISILEDTGYMARITFMMDKVMHKVGLSGKSIVPMIGGLACAVPSIMSTRNIESKKNRIITIMVTPLISCSARLPVYTLLISLVVPSVRLWGLVQLQALALMGMYLIGALSAIGIAWIMKHFIHFKEKGYFIMELPVYRLPRWSNIGLTVYEKLKTFVLNAGKIIVAISIVLWVLSSYGPPTKQRAVSQKYQLLSHKQGNKETIKWLEASEKLENSYAGVLGKAIEPVIKPLGYDWKIGIALITSFAAREVFVGTMATLYSVDSYELHATSLRKKMQEAMYPGTKKPVFTVATAFSLMVFYAFAMQCVSTLAVVYRETKSIRWPLIQFVYMGALAYIASLVVYQILSAYF